MKLLTKAIEKKLPNLHETESQGAAAIAQVKFFTPWSSWSWYATEYDPVEKLFFGLVDGHDMEIGYFSLAELESLRSPMGLTIERDKWWTPSSIESIKSAKTSWSNA